jgi:flagellin
MVIAQNIPSLRTHLSMMRANRLISQSTIRLSSGFKINSAKDDPTGMAISNKLSLQISGIEKATENSSNGVALIQTAEGSLSEIHNMLQRMRELAVQAANDTNTVEDREKMQTEIDQLVDEIQSTSQRTEYNKIKILGGEGNRVTESWMVDTGNILVRDKTVANALYVSEDVQPGKLTYTIDSVSMPAILPLTQLPVPGNATLITDSMKVTINGISFGLKEVDGDVDRLQAKLTETLSYLDIGIKTYGNGNRYMVTNLCGKEQEINISGDNVILAYLGLHSTETSGPKTGTDAVISDLAFYDDNETPNLLADKNSGVSYYGIGNHIYVRGLNGEDVRFNIPVIYNKVLSEDADEPVFTYGDNKEIDDERTMAFNFKDYGALKFQIGGSFNNNISVDIPAMSAETLGFVEYKNGVRHNLYNYCTVDGASRAINQCDGAITMVSHVRSRLGAYQNRLESTVRALDVANENTTSARSRIRDTDMAKEMTAYSSQNVMYQAGISIMTQANQRPQQVLALLNN